MNKDIKFLMPYQEDALRKFWRELADTLEEITNTLKKWDLPSDIDGIFDRYEKGASFERDNAMQEVEEYITRTEMPVYLQADARERARNSVSDAFILEIGNAFSLWRKEWQKEDFIEEDGRIVPSQLLEEKIRESMANTLTAQEEEDWEKMSAFLELGKELQKRYNLDGIVRSLVMSGDVQITEEGQAILMRGNRK